MNNKSKNTLNSIGKLNENEIKEEDESKLEDSNIKEEKQDPETNPKQNGKDKIKDSSSDVKSNQNEVENLAEKYKTNNTKDVKFKYLINLSDQNSEKSVSIDKDLTQLPDKEDQEEHLMNRKLTNINQGKIDVQMIEQIRIDVIRTKQWKNSDYHELLKSLIIKFIIRYESKLEYFQGFNYITSFLLDIFGNQEESLLILDYVKDILLDDFFFDNLCPKLSLLHFQINHVIKYHYPLLHAKWKNNEILSEVLFSSFIISIFTSFVIEDQDFIEEFWDIILIEKWEGVIKVLLYMIEIFYDDIIRMDGNDTMKFFSEMKSEPFILKKVKKHSVKDFVSNLKFNSNFLKDSKKLFLSIEKKNID